MTIVETVEYKGHNINIWLDSYNVDPRDDWDHLSRLANGGRHFDDVGEGAMVPNYVLEHDNVEVIQRYISIFLGGVSTTFWTSGNGEYLAYFDRDVIEKEWQGDKEKALNYLKAESETFRSWAEGEIYGYEIEDYDGMFGTIGGFYGYDFEENGLLQQAREEIDALVKEEQELQSEIDEMRLIELGV